MDFESVFLVVGGVLAITLQVAQAEPSLPGSAHVEVDYADNLLGTQALFAVRACMTEDAPATSGGMPAGNLAAAAPAIREVLTQTPDDVVVRVFDASGREISRQVGAHDVCGYARLSAAFVNTTNRTQQGQKP